MILDVLGPLLPISPTFQSKTLKDMGPGPRNVYGVTFSHSSGETLADALAKSINK